MTVHAITDATGRTLRPPPTGRTPRRRERLRPAQLPPSATPGQFAEPVTITVSVSVQSEADSDRVVRALRDLIAAAGPGAVVDLPAYAQDGPLLATATAPVDAGDRPAARTPGHRHSPACAPVEIHADARTVLRHGLPVRLSRLEYELLVFLVRHPNRVFTREQLLVHVWGHRYAGGRTIDVHIRRLRMKLNLDRPLVTTVHGVGYRLADDPPAHLISE
jgi:hypothetical protein